MSNGSTWNAHNRIKYNPRFSRGGKRRGSLAREVNRQLRGVNEQRAGQRGCVQLVSVHTESAPSVLVLLAQPNHTLGFGTNDNCRDVTDASRVGTVSHRDLITALRRVAGRDRPPPSMAAVNKAHDSGQVCLAFSRDGSFVVQFSLCSSWN